MYWRTAIVTRLTPWGRRAVAIATVTIFGLALIPILTVSGPVASVTLRPLTTVSYLLVGLVLYLALGLAAVWLVSGLSRLTWRTATPQARTRLIRGLTSVAVLAAVATTACGAVIARSPALNQVSYTNEQLPEAFDGYRIALITDVHMGPSYSGAFLRSIVERVNAADVDLVVLGGDLEDGSVEALGPEMAVLKELSARDGVVAVTGNHEFYSDAGAWIENWRSLGITVLDNDATTITRDGQSIDVLGINDKHGTGAHRQDLRLAVERLTVERLAAGSSTPASGERFRLLVAHEPKQAEAADGLAAQVGVDLQLSGHTHAGQLWPLGLVLPLFGPVSQGMGSASGIDVFVSRGAGGWGPPIRVGADPEVPIITLHR